MCFKQPAYEGAQFSHFSQIVLRIFTFSAHFRAFSFGFSNVIVSPSNLSYCYSNYYSPFSFPLLLLSHYKHRENDIFNTIKIQICTDLKGRRTIRIFVYNNCTAIISQQSLKFYDGNFISMPKMRDFGEKCRIWNSIVEKCQNMCIH